VTWSSMTQLAMLERSGIVDVMATMKLDAVALGRRGGLKGGRARAEALSAQDKKAIATQGAQARWPPKATYVGELTIGDMVLPCAVLNTGARVLSARGMTEAFGRSRGGGQYASADSREPGDGVKLPVFLAPRSLKPFVSDALAMALSSPIKYRSNHGGLPALGYRAELLPAICEVWLRARDAGALRQDSLKQAAATADVLMRGLARVGIIALIDEATGYQADRERDELSRILEAYINEELRPWVRMFPHEFFKQIHRLQGWTYNEGDVRGPRYVGKLINKYIYDRLPPGVLEEIRKKNPAVNGRRKTQHHRWLTEETGVPHLDKQITAVTTLMAVSDDKPMFETLLKKRFPKIGDQVPLPSPPMNTDEEE